MTSEHQPCPICGRPAGPKHLPFCSSRCSMIDLGRWLGEGYRIETDEPAAEPAGETGDER